MNVEATEKINDEEVSEVSEQLVNLTKTFNKFLKKMGKKSTSSSKIVNTPKGSSSSKSFDPKRKKKNKVFNVEHVNNLVMCKLMC